MTLKTTSSPIPRAPQFLTGAPAGVSPAGFGVRGGLTGQRRVVPLLEMPEPSPAETGVQSLAPPLPPPAPQPGPEFAARLARAVAELRAQGAALGEQMEADIVEIAVVIAQRVLERELGADKQALFALVRSAVRRLGESRKVVVRLAPSDAAAVQAAGSAGPLGGLPIIKVEVVADAALAPGDVVVDGEHGTVDGKLGTRLDEVRRIVSSALAEAEEQP